jgi:hypothetical protein
MLSISIKKTNYISGKKIIEKILQNVDGVVLFGGAVRDTILNSSICKKMYDDYENEIAPFNVEDLTERYKILQQELEDKSVTPKDWDLLCKDEKTATELKTFIQEKFPEYKVLIDKPRKHYKAIEGKNINVTTVKFKNRTLYELPPILLDIVFINDVNTVNYDMDVNSLTMDKNGTYSVLFNKTGSLWENNKRT